MIDKLEEAMMLLEEIPTDKVRGNTYANKFNRAKNLLGAMLAQAERHKGAEIVTGRWERAAHE